MAFCFQQTSDCLMAFPSTYFLHPDSEAGLLAGSNTMDYSAYHFDQVLEVRWLAVSI